VCSFALPPFERVVAPRAVERVRRRYRDERKVGCPPCGPNRGCFHAVAAVEGVVGRCPAVRRSRPSPGEGVVVSAFGEERVVAVRWKETSGQRLGIVAAAGGAAEYWGSIPPRRLYWCQAKGRNETQRAGRCRSCRPGEEKFAVYPAAGMDGAPRWARPESSLPGGRVCTMRQDCGRFSRRDPRVRAAPGDEVLRGGKGRPPLSREMQVSAGGPAVVGWSSAPSLRPTVAGCGGRRQV